MSKIPGRNVRRARRVFTETNGDGPWPCYGCDDEVTVIGRDTWDGNIHHVDGDVTNDSPDNLVMMHAICHQQLHGPPTEDARRRISEKLRGRPSPTKGMKFPNHWTKADTNGYLNRSRASPVNRKVSKVPKSTVRKILKSTTVKHETSQRPRVDTRGENNPFFGKKHSAEDIEKMRQPRRRVTCDDCGQEWSINWAERHKKDGRCRPAASIMINGVRRTPGKLPKTTCVDCGKPYASRWMERHKKEGKCTVPLT